MVNNMGPEQKIDSSLFQPASEDQILSILAIDESCERGEQILNGEAQLARFKNREGKIWYSQPDTFTPNPEQPREYFDKNKMEELKASMKDKGQIQPINVVPYIDKKNNIKLFIIDGERRYHVLKEIEAPYIKFIIEWERNLEDIFEKSIIINLSKADHNPIEIAKAYQKMIHRRIKEDNVNMEGAIDKVAQKIGTTARRIKNSLKLLGLPEEIQKKIAKNELQSSAALQLIQIRKQYGDLFNAALAARIIIDNIEEDLDIENPIKTIKNITTHKLRRVLIEECVGTDEAHLLKTAKAIKKFAGRVNGLINAANGLIKEDLQKTAIDIIKNQRKGYVSPETIYEKMAKLTELLKEAYKKVIEPSMMPDPLEIPEGAPTFSEKIKEFKSENDVRAKIAQQLAFASDNNIQYAALEIAQNLIKNGTDTDPVTIGNNINSLDRELRELNLKIDSNWKRVKSKQTGKIDKVTAYRLAWIRAEKMCEVAAGDK